MKILIKIVFFLILGGFALGVYFNSYEDKIIGERIIGICVLATAFVLMPLFLAHRWKGKRLQDYTLTKENLDRMNKEKEGNHNKY